MTPALFTIASLSEQFYCVVAKKKKNFDWIKKAVKKPGALRAQLEELGYIKAEDKITEEVLNKAIKYAEEKGDEKLLHRANLAKTLKGFNKKKAAA